MKTYCDGNCSVCPFAENGARNSKKAITAAVVSPYGSFEDETVSLGDYCVHFEYLPEISSILDRLPDVVVGLVDSTRLEDTLYPATKLIDMDVKVVLALEKYDSLLATGHSVDYKALGGLLGFPVIPADYGTQRGKRILFEQVVSIIEHPSESFRDVEVPYGKDVEEEILLLCDEIRKHSGTGKYSARYLAVRLLEGESYILPYIESLPNAVDIMLVAGNSKRNLERMFGKTSVDLVHTARRGFINGALQETLRHSNDDSDHTTAQKIDAVLTNRWLGFPLLVAVLFLVFAATFALGKYPQGWIENGVDMLCLWLRGILPEGWLSSLVVDGIVRGVGAVLAFLPNIIILFFFLSLLEDSGYMARAAFVMDKIMHRIGLHGRSFVPMLIGFGCNVPAIMAARSIDDRKDRTLTMLMIPFMSCSARLPVYMLFVGAFFVKYKALVMMSLYLLGILLSILFAFIMKHTPLFRKRDDDFVSELPEFRKPTWRNTGHHIWERVADYLQKISTVILAASVIIWALEYFPADRTDRGVNKEESYLAMVGKAVSPVMEPLGFDWKMNVCLITGLPAKEAIVSTMGILYHADDNTSLAAAMRSSGDFTPATAIAFMLFVLLYFPCIATVNTLRREIGRGWAAFTVIHSLLLAWAVAFVAFRLLTLLL